MKLKWLIAVLGLQTAWILGTVITQENILSGGKTVLLETQPVDPRDPLRGDFVRLSYKISNVPREKFSPAVSGELKAGTTLYVALAPAGTNGFWEVTRASLDRFSPAGNEVLVRGKSRWMWQSQSGPVQIEYGLEHYFVAEGTGNPRGKLTVQAAISGSGRAAIKQVFVDGRPYIEVAKEQVK